MIKPEKAKNMERPDDLHVFKELASCGYMMEVLIMLETFNY